MADSNVVEITESVSTALPDAMCALRIDPQMRPESGKAFVLSHGDNETLKQYANRGSKAAIREVKRRFKMGDYL
jgi:hypothetical protein